MDVLTLIFTDVWHFLGFFALFALFAKMVEHSAIAIGLGMHKCYTGRIENVNAPEEPKWRIWSIEHTGWWMPNGNGYTNKLDEAGLYTYTKATEIVRGANRNLDYNKHLPPNEAMVLVDES